MDQKILDYLHTQDPSLNLNSYELSQKMQESHDDVVGGLKSLEAKNYLELKQQKENKFQLTKEGEQFASKGMPEHQILQVLLGQPERRQDKKVVESFIGKSFKIGLSNGMKEKLFKVQDQFLVANDFDSTPEDTLSETLKKLQKSEFFDGNFKNLEKLKDLKNLKKRKQVQIKSLVYYQLSKGENYGNKLVQLKADITMQDINQGTWQDKSLFKELNLQAKGKELESGGLHPLMKLRSKFRHILLEMGFKEMNTNRYVESSYWNFDTLFQPQQHPARDSHDTFFLKNPSKCEYISDDMKAYVDMVKEIHQNGFRSEIEESYGWQYQWDIEESRKNILRTHTTAVSSRYLKQIADEYKKTGVLQEQKLFSVDRVFRNETLDATHLAEFHQVEGLIVGKNLGLPQLKCFIRDFFAKIGITKLKFKPAYNPYTEPSMEIFVYHPQLKKTIEIGNSGVFRPEMLRPMGLPNDCSVIAWGLSLERPAMIAFQCSNIRDLLGYKVNFKTVQNAEMIRFE